MIGWVWALLLLFLMPLPARAELAPLLRQTEQYLEQLQDAKVYGGALANALAAIRQQQYRRALVALLAEDRTAIFDAPNYRLTPVLAVLALATRDSATALQLMQQAELQWRVLTRQALCIYREDRPPIRDRDPDRIWDGAVLARVAGRMCGEVYEGYYGEEPGALDRAYHTLLTQLLAEAGQSP